MLPFVIDAPQQGFSTPTLASKKITDSAPLITRSTIWYAGEPEMEPVVSSYPAIDGVKPGDSEQCHDSAKGLESVASIWTPSRSAIIVGANTSADWAMDADGNSRKLESHNLAEFTQLGAAGILTRSRSAVILGTEAGESGLVMEPDAEEGASNSTVIFRHSDAMSRCEIRQAVAAAVSHAVAVGAMESSLRLPVLPVSPTPSAASTRSAPFFDTENEEEHEPDAEQDVSMPIGKEEDIVDAEEVRQAVAAAVAHAFAAGVMDAALRATSTSATGPSQDASGIAVAPSHCSPVLDPTRNRHHERKVEREPTRNLKLLAWCCK